ncbi:ABC transporter substrate-binding protein [Megalodesulfovibrio paquesii]
MLEIRRDVGLAGRAAGPMVMAVLLVVVCVVAGCKTTPPNDDGAADAVPGVNATSVRIGSSLALTGHASFLGRQTLQGAEALLREVNERGGVHGRRLELVARDDGYDPPRCLMNTQRFIVEQNIFALFCYVGTPTTVKIIPLVQRARIPLIGMFTGAKDLREPFNRYIINVRASYYQETGAAVEHIVEQLGLRKIAIFYQYDAYGLDGLRGAELALLNYDAAPVAKSSYIRGTLQVEHGLERILESDAEAVIMIGTYEPCAKFIKLAKARKPNLLFYNVSFVGAEELARLLGKEGAGVIVSQVAPPPELPESRELVDEVQTYLELSGKHFPDGTTSSVGLEGYLNALVLVEGLTRAGPHLTREGFIDAVESIREKRLGARTVISFAKDDHQGLDAVYFTWIRDGRLQLITDWKEVADVFRLATAAPPAVQAPAGPGGGQ